MIGQTNSINKINGKYEQLVNYTMLYDGSLGDAELNQCKNITGGWSGVTENTSSAKRNNTFEKRNDSLYHKSGSQTGSTSTWYGKFTTNNTVSPAGYAKALGVASTSKGSASYSEALWIYGAGINFSNASFSSVKQIKIISVSDFSGYIDTGCRDSDYSIFALGYLKQDNWQELCTIAGLNSSDYTDEATLCADITAITTILSKKNAVNYIIYNCTGSFMGEFIASDICLTALNNSPYKTKILANEHWAKFLSFVA